MKLSRSTTAFLACHWQNDVAGSDGAFAPPSRRAPIWMARSPTAKVSADACRSSRPERNVTITATTTMFLTSSPSDC